MKILKIPHNGKMWKDKWNNLISNYKTVSNYHIGINHTIHFGIWQLKNATTAIFQIKQFNEKLYVVTQAFQTEMMINALGHMKDFRAKRDIVVYMPPNAKLSIKYFFAHHISMVQFKLIGDDYMINEHGNEGWQVANANVIK